ncbi:2-dehydropantoate 2-reductase [Bacillus sp. USDA818B3_A]|uniref:2-dehydropantoate 2-reductase n=1 Tax=Bacillus sp. USDA818B3_A TaxID=2698834 RepID=UPI001367FA46|nr:2-dehydropantoate 2-reductase [Bacillus sp. USDA818B3_A]
MRISIIGAGSIGLLFAAYLSRGFNVTVYTRSAEQAVEINKNGIVLLNGTGETVSKVEALPITDWKGEEDLAIITVKQYQLAPIIERINQLDPLPSSLLFLQNGMGHLKQLEQLEVHNLFVGSVEHGALKQNPFTVKHNGAGTTNAAVYRGDPRLLKLFLEAVSNVFSMTYQEDYYPMLEKKLIANALINPLTAILQVKNGELIDNPYYFKVLQNLFSEITFILNLKNPQENWSQVIKICKQTADNRSSMLKDLEGNRLTEVDAIVGYILDKAESQGKKSSPFETLFYLIKGKEKQGEVLE